ncbi:hypothetical protein GCM10010909_16010 [Acidocella aquatica]|uniref:Uncharacterized protein n=1 Tax=Acidocella aquatica TaxID=1922313 RepID=A0ABQ6A3A2_9PROT|nr:hypothetical protein [Acidocella aquatica]GLR66921.1 hypothetical protein GCM10010909_16010 [Acidocella aquatica]
MNDLVFRSEAKISARDFTSFSLEKSLSMSVTQKTSAASTLRHDITTAIDTGVNVAAFIRDLAGRHGVNFVESDLDRFAAAASRLSDAEVQPDETADLLLAIYRAGVISNDENIALYNAHLRQTIG